jgi:hypothetical protein
MTIKQSVINTFNRIGIDPTLDNTSKSQEAFNRFSGESVAVTPLVAECIAKVYEISNQYEGGNYKIPTSDFDRIRYFVAEVDPTAYNTCLD